jgi:hypothetical protein
MTVTRCNCNLLRPDQCCSLAIRRPRYVCGAPFVNRMFSLVDLWGGERFSKFLRGLRHSAVLHAVLCEN